MNFHLYDVRGGSIVEDLGGYNTEKEAETFAQEYWKESHGECGLLLTHGPITEDERGCLVFDPVDGWNGW